jgi:ubiquinone/menaquinone biosynthesis C-methylase UbiE
MKLSTDKILLSTHNEIIKRLPGLSRRYLDIGSGTGELILIIKNSFPVDSYAIDYTSTLINIPTQKVDIVNLNKCKLPYDNNSIQAITITEVIEHLENYRCILREINRTLEPDGLVVISTPNILNLKSRFRFLFNGFYNLFGPLPTNTTDIHSANGHITPISLYYLSHALLESGFSNIEMSIDKTQKTSILLLIPMLPFIIIGGFLFKKKEKKKYQTITHSNELYVNLINSVDALCGRTIILSATKKKITQSK